MAFTPSKYQQAIYDWVLNGQGNAVINAVAGSGKTTTLINVLEKIPATSKVLFLAFNKSIVEELKLKTARFANVDVRTLHSLGCSAIKRQIKCEINSSKYKEYINSGLKSGVIKPTKELAGEIIGEYKDNIRKLVDLARVNLCEKPSEILSVAHKHHIHLQDNEISIVERCIVWGRQFLDAIDYTDMIYFPNIMDIRMPAYDFVLIDECQDLNAAQRNMFLRCVKRSGRFIAVGDPRQAIYGFAGADVESFNLLTKLPNTVQLPLSVCYRCDQDIIKRAQEIVPQIEWREGADAGTVNNEGLIENVKDGDMVLCRNTAPLTKLCMRYIGSGVKAYIKGKDIGKNLINMLERTRKIRYEDALKAFQKESKRILNEIMEKTSCSEPEAMEEDAYLTYYDKIQAIMVLGEGCTTVAEICSRIDSIFSDYDRQGICLSTIHKSKGLEAERVWILCPELMLPKRSMNVAWMAEQEYNLMYVAYTRAKHYLGFITDFKL